MKEQTLRQKLNSELNSRTEADYTPIIKAIGYLIYLSGLIYAGSHIITFVNTIMTGNDFLRLMGYIGAIGIILNGAVLPITIHYWLQDPLHRGAGFFFYALDLILIAGFVWSNTNLTLGTGLDMAQGWLQWVSPLTFMNTLLTWAVLLTLDPSQRQRHRINKAMAELEEIKIQTQTYLAIKSAEATSERLLLEAGIDPDDMSSRTSRNSGSILDVPSRTPEPYWKHEDLFNKLSNRPDEKPKAFEGIRHNLTFDEFKAPFETPTEPVHTYDTEELPEDFRALDEPSSNGHADNPNFL